MGLGVASLMQKYYEDECRHDPIQRHDPNGSADEKASRCLRSPITLDMEHDEARDDEEHIDPNTEGLHFIDQVETFVEEGTREMRDRHRDRGESP